MFGYITADPSQLEEHQIQRYSGCYCGLCRALQQRHGFLCRLTLTYDMTFLILLLSSLYEPDEQHGSERCPVHPLRKKDYWTSRYTDYAADLNVLLAWWNCMDDWQDEKRLSRLALATGMKRTVKKLELKYPRQSKTISQQLQLLHQYETGAMVDPDAAAACFGNLMGELFVINESDYWADTLRQLGQGLGRFIYIMDACIDFESDKKKNRPNPLLPLSDGLRDKESDYQLLSMLLSDCTIAFERLPILQDIDLMRNILYAGVWQKYNQELFQREKRRKETEKVKVNEGPL